jgi:hypothetical protein
LGEKADDERPHFVEAISIAMQIEDLPRQISRRGRNTAFRE